MKMRPVYAVARQLLAEHGMLSVIPTLHKATKFLIHETIRAKFSGVFQQDYQVTTSANPSPVWVEGAVMADYDPGYERTLTGDDGSLWAVARVGMLLHANLCQWHGFIELPGDMFGMVTLDYDAARDSFRITGGIDAPTAADETHWRNLAFALMLTVGTVLEADPEVVERDVVRPVSQRNARGDRLYPHVELRSAVIEAARRRYDALHAEATTPGSPKRLHPVREHLRRYRTGKVVRVRQHMRGDASLGLIDRSHYVVRAATAAHGEGW